MKFNEISQESVFRRTNSVLVTMWVEFYQFVAPHGRGFKIRRFGRTKQTGRRAISLTTLGSFSVEDAIERKTIFVEPEVQEVNYDIDGRVRIAIINFRAAILHHTFQSFSKFTCLTYDTVVLFSCQN